MNKILREHFIKQSINCIFGAIFLLHCGVSNATPVLEDRDPEAAGKATAKQVVVAKQYMVSSANPHATRAGEAILAKGGSAIDAAIAVQVMLGLVEPQSSGIGGGSFILHYDAKTQRMQSYDGREAAPKSAKPEMFLAADGTPQRWIDMVVGGKSVGVPGVLKALYKAHQQHGKLAWAELFDDAIALAEKGFEVSPRMALQIHRGINPAINKLASSRDYFSPGGKPLQAGDLLINKPYAAILRKIAKQGPKAFYQGDNAKAILARVNNAEYNPGNMSLADLAEYEAKERPPLCAPYHQYKLCGMGPPSSGSFTVLQILALLESFELNRYEANQAQAIHLYTQASRLAYADRNRYAADSDFVNVPFAELLAPDYIKTRAKLIDPNKDMGKASAGLSQRYAQLANDNAIELPSTSHLSIVDSKGNAISMTTSIEHAFGSGLMVNGYLLNNQLTDFSFAPKNGGKWVANRIEAGKRPRSSMSPMMIFDKNGKLKMLIGSPGGSRIIGYVAHTIIGVLDWQLDIQKAISLAKVTNRNGQTTLESDTKVVDIKAALEKLGHQVQVRPLNSGLHGIVIDNGRLYGGADPRREGLVLGK